MGLSGLDIALSGLNIAQRQLSVISNNISNASTPGYTRKILPQETVVSNNGENFGVRGSVIQRQVDLNLSKDYWTQISQVENLNVKSTYLNQIMQFHGSPDSETNISAELAELKDMFISLADTPEDAFLQSQVVNQAIEFADKMNDLQGLLTDMRNDAQTEIDLSISRVNDKLEQISELNRNISYAIASNRTTAALEDQRDILVNEISEELEISTFIRGDGVMVIQTEQGELLAEETAKELVFNGSILSVNSFYPDSAGGITIGDPDTQPNTTDITRSSLGGKIGAYIELRDEILPEQQAQIDELAYQVARRFDAQGLRLFTNSTGGLPDNTAPIADPPSPVDYVGFASEFQVNPAILTDNTIIQQGTTATDSTVQTSSNEVIRRIVDFVFSDIESQQAIGTVDLSVAATIQETIGLYSSAELNSTVDFSQYTSVADIITIAGGEMDPPNDQFTITFTDPDMEMAPINATPKTITIDMSDTAALPGDAQTQIQTAINIALAAAPAIDPLWDVQVGFDSNGQLLIESRGNIVVDASGVNGMGDTGLAFLGLESGTTEAVDPYFDIQVGDGITTRVTLEPLDDVNSLYDKLDHDGTTMDEGVFGLAVDPELTGGDGRLRIRPGDDYNDPNFGGDITIIGGPFQTAGNVGIVEALFGSVVPVSELSYSSLDASGGSVPFRTNNLGPNADISTGIISSTNIIDYAQKMINSHSEAASLTETKQVDEETYRELLQTRLLDESGVNIEEELANLVRIQTAFAAASRVVQAIDEEFRSFIASL